MAKLSAILQQRFRNKKDKGKMAELAEKTTDGGLTVFSGVFGSSEVGEKERSELSEILQKYAESDEIDVSQDLKSLVAITSEVKAINNQAAILHGERIKRAQQILKKYRDGAFTAWLLTTYGNRQTPYNFLQYYEFYNTMPKTLHTKIESMPRQAVYSLASREGSYSAKEKIVRDYKGETKQQMITLIRTVFPLSEDDRRRENIGENALKVVNKIISSFEGQKVKLTGKQKKTLHEQLDLLSALVDQCKLEK